MLLLEGLKALSKFASIPTCNFPPEVFPFVYSDIQLSHTKNVLCKHIEKDILLSFFGSFLIDIRNIPQSERYIQVLSIWLWTQDVKTVGAIHKRRSNSYNIQDPFSCGRELLSL